MFKFPAIVLMLFCYGFKPCLAQDTLNGRLSIGAYLDTYFCFDGNRPVSGNRAFAVSSSRTDEFALNLAYIDVTYQSEVFRARIAPAFGTYMNANYAGEPNGLKNVLEASAGIKLSARRGIWLDAGVLPSPFTNETAISKDQWMYSRSLSAENVPYYLAGVKLAVPISKKLTAFAYLINGWQEIQNQNKTLSFATQLEYKANKNLLLNYNVYLGDEQSTANPDYRFRQFHDFFAILFPENKVSVSISAYAGNQEAIETIGSNRQKKQYWWSQGNVITRYRFAKKMALSGRLEFFNDPHAVMLKPVSIANLSGKNQSFPGSNSYGLCWDVQLNKHALFRMEGRHFVNQSDAYFVNRNSKYLKTDNLLLASLCFWY